MKNIIKIDDLLEWLHIKDVPSSIVASMIATPASFYRSFSIKKRRGGERIINSPFASLDFIQKKIYQSLYHDERFHHSAYAFVKGKNAILHAKEHISSSELLTLDIEDFFGTITQKKVIQALDVIGFSSAASFYISSLCCLENKLPQGASTSPLLSNIIFTPVDIRLSALARHFGVTYSRYADDLAFSGEKIPFKLYSYISEILASSGFSINNEKTNFKKYNSKKIITGVSISSGSLKAPKKYKRELRKKIFLIEKNIDNLSKIHPLDPLIFERTIGQINYVLQIEPDNEYYLSKKKTLSKYHQGFIKK